MTNLHEDPKLTAYALGEYESLAAGEREAIERQLAADVSLREAVETIRALGGDLERELAAEDGAAALNAAQKKAIERAAVAPKAPGSNVTRRPWSAWGIGAAAALLAVAATLYTSSAMKKEADYEQAQASPQAAGRGADHEAPRTSVARSQYASSDDPLVIHEESELPGETVGDLPLGGLKTVTTVVPEPRDPSSSMQPASRSNPDAATSSSGGTRSGGAGQFPGEWDEYSPAQQPDNLAGDAVLSQAKGDPLKFVEVKPGKINAVEHVYFRREAVQQRIALLAKALLDETEPAAKRRLTDELALANSFLARIQQPGQASNSESYARISEQPFKIAAGSDAVSTFSIDVDTASYSNVRRHLDNNRLPPADAVRVEEMINYFSYDYALPKDEHPFAAHVEVGSCPWEPAHRLVRIGLKGREIAQDKRPASNLVFLLDVSGSMNAHNKLPLVKQAMNMLVQRLNAHDRVAIVVYAGASGLVLPSTTGDQGATITAALNRLSAGGSTNGGAGIELAYMVAQQHFIKGGINRVILCTDGDFNVGNVRHGTLRDMIEQKAKSGVFLTVLGFGMGNYKDDTLELLADKGNGNYGYIDTANEARKMLVEQMDSTLVTIAKDVKIQVEFNPARVDAYRLIGYENRVMAREDFNDDTKDAGEIGAGHTVTALYEVVPAGSSGTVAVPEVDGMRYQQPTELTGTAYGKEMLTLKLRYKQPEGDTSTLMETHVTDEGKEFGKTTREFRFASAVASFGMLLRNSKYSGPVTMEFVRELAEEAKGADPYGYRAEFIGLVEKAAALEEKMLIRKR